MKRSAVRGLEVPRSIAILGLAFLTSCGSEQSSSRSAPTQDAGVDVAADVAVDIALDIAADVVMDGPAGADAPSDRSMDALLEAQTDDVAPGKDEQCIVVVANDATTFHAQLYGFDRTDGVWNQVLAFPVTIGRKGLAWGIGVHDSADIPPGETMKVEGDGKSPMGRFLLPRAWGYLPSDEVDTKLPYATATSSLLCIDDVTSSYYNQVIDREAEGLPPDGLPSHEDMLRPDDLYKYTVFVAHNAPDPTPGAGSCIFMHLWGGADSSTSGCTAMAESNMVDLLRWIDPDRSPTLVQLTRSHYGDFQTTWDLPPIP